MMMRMKRETRKERHRNNINLREGHIRTVRGGRQDGNN